MLIYGKKARVQFDTGTIGTNLISTVFVITYGIKCTQMEKPTCILMAMKGSKSGSQKECLVDISVELPGGSMHTKGNKMIVGNLAKYDALIGMSFLNKHKATI